MASVHAQTFLNSEQISLVSADDKPSLRVAFVNDLHLEPDWNNKYNDFKSRKAGDLKLCKAYEDGDDNFKKTLAGAIKEALSIQQTYAIRQSLEGDSPPFKDLADQWTAWSADQDIIQVGAVLNLASDMFKAVDTYDLFPLELCTWLEKYGAKSDVDFGNITMSCNTERGFYGVDSPPALLDWFLDRMKEQYNDKFPDVFIVNGDFIGHKRAPDANATRDEKFNKWNENKNIMNDALNKVRGRANGKPVLPSVGNNDVMAHDQVACSDEERQKYYRELYDVWFPGNAIPAGMDRNKVWEESFKYGGYYRYNMTGDNSMDLSIISLNTMFFMKENMCDAENGQKQLDWLKQELDYVDQTRNTKFMLNMHVFPGLNLYDMEFEQFWHANYTTSFLDILNDKADKIFMMSGAHIHHEQIRITTSSKHPNVKIPMYVSPSVTPIYLNNPAMSFMTVQKDDQDKLGVVNLDISWYQLQNKIMNFQDSIFVKYEQLTEYNVDLLQGKQLDYFEKITNSTALTQFMARSFGGDALWANLFLPLVMVGYADANPNYSAHLLCTLMWYSKEDPQWQGCLDTRLGHAITQTMVWAIIVLCAIFLIGCIATAVYINRRRVAQEDQAAGQKSYVYEHANGDEAHANVHINSADEQAALNHSSQQPHGGAHHESAEL